MAAELAAIEALYRTSYDRYRNALATVTGSYESARDAVQQAFAQAISERASFRGDGSLAAWVWKIALRQALGLRIEFADANLNGVLDPKLVEPAYDPALVTALRDLPPRRRLIVFLRYFADLDYRAIGEALEISPGTVGATLTAARSALQELLVKEEAR